MNFGIKPWLGLMHNWVYLKIGNAPYSIWYALQMEFVTCFFEFFGEKIEKVLMWLIAG
jgi:hypothetical protein